MTLEEILAKLPDDEKEILKNHITTSVSNAVSEKEVSLQTEKALVEKKNSELKAELDALKNVQKPNQEDILASVSPEIKAMLESANKKALEAEAALQKIQDEKELECFVNKAKAFDKLPINAEEFGPVFKTFAKADKEGFEKLEALLKAANNVIDAGALFATNGTTKGNEGANAWETIQNKANALVKDGKVKTFADALSVVMKEEPDLYNQYLHEMQGDSVITE